MEIQHLHREGLTVRHIARRLGMDRRTVAKYVREPREPHYRERKPVASILDPYKANIQALLGEDEGYSAMWMHERLRALGYGGSYEVVKCYVRQVKAERSRVAYQRFESAPGVQAQVDYGEFVVEFPNGQVRKYYLFAMLLGYSRMLYVEFVEKCDLMTFLDCHVHAFEFFGGVPREILYDRMRNVYIRKLAGKAVFNESLCSLALHYGFTPLVAPAYAPWVKGKVERPFSFVREGFWRGYSFSCLETANRDALGWLRRKAERIHGTTNEQVIERFRREQPSLRPLPCGLFDTSYRVFRTVYKDCCVRFECNWYVLPHRLVGRKVVLRVKDHALRVFADDVLVVTYTIPEGKGELVQDPRFYEALRADPEMNRRKYGAPKRTKGRAHGTISPAQGRYEVVVESRDVGVYSRVAEGVAYE